MDVPDSSKAASLWANIIFALIIVTIIAFTMENQIGSNMGAAPDADRLLGFFVLDAIVNTIFTVELVLRVFVAKDLKAFCLNLCVVAGVSRVCHGWLWLGRSAQFGSGGGRECCACAWCWGLQPCRDPPA